MRRSIGLVAAAAVAVEWSPAIAAHLPAAARAFGIATNVPSARGVLLSFDDGPHPQGTPAVLAALDRAAAPAVFFVSGEQALRHPQLVHEITAADLVLLLTDHPDVPYDDIATHASLVLDTRGRLRGRPFRGETL